MIVNEERILAFETTTPLGANEVYTSASVDARRAGRITGLIYSDQSSAIDGVKVQQSIDGSNWDYESTFTLTGGSGLAFSVELVAAYARIRYENGATAQAEFRLACYLS